MRRSGVKTEQAWVPGWTLSIKKTLPHPHSSRWGSRKMSLTWKCSQSVFVAECLKSKWYFWDKKKSHQVLISEIKHPCLSPRKKENRKQKQKQNTSNTEFKSMYTSKILKTAEIKKRQNLRSQWNTLNLADKNLVRKKKKTNITLSNIHTVTKHYGIACINIVRLFYITYTRRSWLTDSEGYRCRKFLRPKSNIIQISQALHFNISGIMLVFL